MAADAYTYRKLEGAPGGDLLFLFHGTGGNEAQLVDVGRQVMAEATLVAPRGDVAEHGAARFFRRTSEGIYDMEDLARATGKMAGFVAAHAEAAPARFVAGLGYSNGANILASVVIAEPGVFDAAVLMHPLIPFVPRILGSLAGTAILVTAGRADTICPPELVTRLETCLRAAGAEVETVWHEGGHELRPGELEAAARFLARHRTHERAGNA